VSQKEAQGKYTDQRQNPPDPAAALLRLGRAGNLCIGRLDTGNDGRSRVRIGIDLIFHPAIRAIARARAQRRPASRTKRLHIDTLRKKSVLSKTETGP
jgi:hypothetical protein